MNSQKPLLREIDRVPHPAAPRHLLNAEHLRLRDFYFVRQPFMNGWNVNKSLIL